MPRQKASTMKRRSRRLSTKVDAEGRIDRQGELESRFFVRDVYLARYESFTPTQRKRNSREEILWDGWLSRYGKFDYKLVPTYSFRRATLELRG